MSGKCPLRVTIVLAALLAASRAAAQVLAAEPVDPIVAVYPATEPPRETQVTLQVVVDATGAVESAVEISRLPPDASNAFVTAAVDAATKARFTPSSRDGQAFRSRIEYVVVFHPPSTPSPPPPPPPTVAPSPAPPPPATVPVETVEVRGITWSSPRGLGDLRVDRETLTASPRQQTSEMLSAAPGFFVDHEDGEGLGNDVYLRGFDLDNGSGIEMKVGEVPINVPLHIHGQGYADVNFIIPEVVRSIRVLEGPYDPRQGDSAIVGSALFDLGVTERGYQLKTTYGSFDQARIVGIAAPEDASDETFAAFSLRETHGFGQDRASKSASVNAQYGIDLTDRDHLRLLATAYASSAALPGVVRQDDVDAGRIDYYGAYPYFNSYFPTNCTSPSCAQPAQGVQAARVIVSGELDHATDGRRPLRRRAVGDVDQLPLAPELHGGLEQLESPTAAREPRRSLAAHQRRDRMGRHRPLPRRPDPPRDRTSRWRWSPVVSLRAGHTDQSKELVNPADLEPWDYRENYGLETLDLAGYVDLDARLWKKLRISGGVRADFLDVDITNNLAGVTPPIPAGALQGSTTNVAGVAPGPRVTVAYEIVPELTPVVSAGEGFRSLDAGSLTRCNAPTVQLTGVPSSAVLPCSPGSPFSRVTSFEAGFRSEAAAGPLRGDGHRLRDRRRQRASFRGRFGRAHDGEREHAARRRRLLSRAARGLAARLDGSVAPDGDVQHARRRQFALRAQRSRVPLAGRCQRARRASPYVRQPDHGARGRRVHPHRRSPRERRHPGAHEQRPQRAGVVAVSVRGGWPRRLQPPWLEVRRR